MKECFLSVIIPAYNEEKRLLPTLRKICAYLSTKDFPYEIIVVDDGSTDNTLQITRNFANSNDHIIILANEQNSGKGYSVRRGMLSALGEYVFFTDADLSTPIEEIEKCLPYLVNGYDVVIGSRSMPGADIIVHQPWYREKMGKIFNFMVNMVLLNGIIDTQCGFKGFKREAVKTVFSRCKIDGFSFDVEALYLSRKYNFKIKEIPIRWENSALSKVSPIKHSLQMFKDLIGIKIKDLKGYYK
ncbi:MAG TPA: dolichyl-phosphate beta-glucosyltransferase [Candidatus Wunengus sp. YC60]|uniref:dolichyl-phosphate beta-glucosyltransferase n=1 Tax=Candidatus Wunengus sp. YC60 TaxID=3367697 RepID=UPI00402939E4